MSPSSRGLRVQSPSLTQRKSRAERPANPKKTRRARRALIGSLRDSGLPLNRAEAYVSTMDVLADAMKAVEFACRVEAEMGRWSR